MKNYFFLPRSFALNCHIRKTYRELRVIVKIQCLNDHNGFAKDLIEAPGLVNGQ